MQRQTGARKTRFLLGKWEAAEGLVYEFRESIHMHPPGWVAPRVWPRVWGIDWGKRAPTVLGVWAIDPDGGMHLTREVYQTHLRPDVLGRRAAAWLDTGAEPRPLAVVCDHDTGNEGYQQLFEKASGLHLILADKEDRKKGIQDLQQAFDLADDGKPRIMFCVNTLDHEEDSDLADAGLPTSGISEIVGYIWDEDQLKDEPIDYNDHFCDMARYVKRYVRTRMSFGPRPQFQYRPEDRRTWRPKG